MQVALCNALDLAAHGGREEQRVAVLWHALEDGVYRVGKAHVEHLVSLVEHHVLNLVELCHATVHEVDESSRCGHDDLCAVLQRMDLVNDAGASINSHHVDALDILGKIFQVVSDL